MFYHLLYPLSNDLGLLNIFRYITLRSFLAFFFSIAIVIAIGGFFIKFMRAKQFGQIIRDDGPKKHLEKVGTPTFGGVLILFSILFTILFCGNFSSLPLNLCLVILFSFAGIGFCDDYLKVLKKNTKGLSGKLKLFWQTSITLAVVYYGRKEGIIDTKVFLPFLKDTWFDLGLVHYLFSICVVVGSSNAVNLTDGLDGLAIGPIITGAASLGILAYVGGNLKMASYLYIPYVENLGEITVLASAIIGAGLGFLWYNGYPAQIFMGDVGSLSLGGILGMMALISKNEILFVIIGGIFVVETLSVIIQVASFKLKGKRVFRMAPIHHHFELKGHPEPRVIVRFWIISIVLAIVGLATLKLR